MFKCIFECVNNLATVNDDRQGSPLVVVELNRVYFNLLQIKNKKVKRFAKDELSTMQSFDRKTSFVFELYLYTLLVYQATDEDIVIKLRALFSLMASVLVSGSSGPGSSPGRESLCCVLGQDTLLSQCLSPPRSINGYRRN